MKSKWLLAYEKMTNDPVAFKYNKTAFNTSGWQTPKRLVAFHLEL